MARPYDFRGIKRKDGTNYNTYKMLAERNPLVCDERKSFTGWINGD
jgi:hypothetical protein